MTVEPPPPAWYVLHTRSRFENVVRDGLERKSLEVFLPIVPVPSRRRDRRMMIRVPLFPGYVFVRSSLNPSEHLDILKTTGAVRLIGTTQGPVPVPREAIDSLRIMVAAEQPLATGSRLRHGDRVVVINGPFTGVIGVFVRYTGKDRVLVQIEALGRYAAVSVSGADVEKLPPILS